MVSRAEEGLVKLGEERSDKWISKCTHLEIDGFKGRGRPHKT